MKFYVLPTEEHPNETKEYTLIREGTLKLFTGESYEETKEEERLSKRLNQGYEVLEFEVNDTLRTKAFKVVLDGTQTYKSTPLDLDIITKPCIYQSKTHPQRLRFPKQKQIQANIGIIKAYKKHTNSNIQTHTSLSTNTDTHIFLEDFTGLNNPHNEIYTIDLKQEIQLKAFIYEKQKTKSDGNITKTIITDKSRFNNIAEEEIHWAFKIVEGTYLADEKKNTSEDSKENNNKNPKRNNAFPPLGKKQSFKISNETPKLTSIPKGYVVLENKTGDCITLKLSDIFDKEFLNNLIDKNIIFFAYANSPAYCLYKKNNNDVSEDRVTSIELKIVKSRFRLEFDGKSLLLLENERKLGEWEARSGMPIENFQEDSKENKERQRFCIPYKENTSFYYDRDLHTQDSTKPLKEGVYYIKPNVNDAPHRIIGDKELGKHKLSLYNIDKEKIDANYPTSYSIHGGKELGDAQGIDLAQNMKNFYKKIGAIAQAQHIDYILLKVQYQKRILILMERFHQTTESTKARMNIYLDNKRVDSNGNIIGEKTKQYESYNPNNLPTNNPYAYILERNGPDSIGGEIKLRIPSGRYNALWHNGKTFKNALKLHNEFVGAERAILIHDGISPKNSDGCLLISSQNEPFDDVSLAWKDTKTMKELFAELLTTHFFKKIDNKQPTNVFVSNNIEIRIIFS